MYITKVLKRKDAASLVLAIILGFAIGQTIFQISYDIAQRVAFLGEEQQSFAGPGWRYSYLMPIISIVVSTLLIEVLLRVFVAVRGKLVRRVK